MSENQPSTPFQARTIAITSGKGGVGKSNIAVNIAIALAQAGRRVILWDLDLGLANVDVLLNLRVTADLSHVISKEKSLKEVVATGPAGVRVVPGASGDERLADLDENRAKHLLKGIAELSREADFLIIDTGAGVSRNIMRFAAAADEVLVVTTPEPTAMLDAYAVVKLLTRDGPATELHLIVNMARNAREAQNTLWRISASAENFIGSHLEEDGFILYDPAVGDAVRRRIPVLLASPDSPAAQALRNVAKLLDAHPPSNLRQREAQSGGFIRRLYRQLTGND